MSEYKHFAKYCPVCSQKLTTRSLYCSACGERIPIPILEFKTKPFFWSPKTTYVLTGVAFGISVLSTIFLFFYYIFFFGIPFTIGGLNSLLNDPLFLILSTILGFSLLLVPLSYVISLKAPLSSLGIKSGGILTFLKDVLWGLVVGVSMIPFVLLLTFYDVIPPVPGSPLVPSGPSGFFWLILLLLTFWLVVAPTEEVLFRGFVQSSLDHHYGDLGGLLVSSIIFGLVHFNPLLSVGVIQAVLGVVLGLLYQKRGRRLAAPVTAHALYDCLLVLIDLFLL